MISHHPSDELLLAAAAGTLERGPAIVLAAHLEACAQCRAGVRLFEGVGGAMLEAIEPALLAPEALARTLARIDGEAAAAPPARRGPGAPSAHPPLPAGVSWPRALHDCTVSRWRWIAPGMRWSRVTVPGATGANVMLLRIGPGKFLPRHTHSGVELTHVMCGSFDDGRAGFAPGDFDATDGTIRHQPVVRPGSECICLASVDGRLVFDGAIARAIGALVGL